MTRSYIEGWKRHQGLWKVDRGSVLAKFAAKGPLTAEFEDKMSRYWRMAAEAGNQARRSPT